MREFLHGCLRKLVILSPGSGNLNPETDCWPEWALINESDQAERAISTGKLNASLSFALTHPAYRRGGLPRLFRETSFRGGFPA